MQSVDIQKTADRIKYLREVLGLSAGEVAGAVGVTEEQYLLAEDGKVDFTFSFLQTLAKFLGVDIVELISGDAPKLQSFQIVRKGEGMQLERRKGFKYMHVASHFKGKIAEPFMVTARYHEGEEKQPMHLSTHNDQEFDMVVKGKLKFQIDDYVTVLEEGDTAYYNANIPHGMIALGGDCEFLAVVMKIGTDEVGHQETEDGFSRVTTSNKAIYNSFVTPTVDEKGKLTAIDFHPPVNFNFGYDVVDELARRNPTKPAMVWVSKHKEEKIFTFEDMRRESNKVANYLRSLGIGKGDKVMIVMKRHYRFWFTMLALHKLGAVAIPATFLLTEKDFTYRFKSADVKGIVVTADGDTALECEKSFEKCPDVKVKVLCEGRRAGWESLDDSVNMSPELERVDTQIDDTMLMYFTSGTTGYPKIAEHSHRYALGHFVTGKYWHNISSDSLHLTVADTGWGKAVWGKLYGQWLSEGCVFTYDFDKFDAADILPMFAQYKINSFCAPPTIYRFLIKENLSAYDLSSLRYATTAGEALNLEVYEQFYKATGLKVMEGFGQTETTLTICNLVGSDIKPGSMGKPSPQFDVDIVDADGEPVGTGVSGEIVIRTDKKVPFGLFKGYYKDADATKAVWHDGMYHTGDIAWRDEDGFYWYDGRVDDVIKSSGYRIGPFEVESVLMELPYVLECAITGVPHPTRGQVVKASIILVKGKQGSDELIKEIQDYVKHRTAPYKYPRIVEFADSLPKTISGKIMRKAIREKKD